MHSADNNEGMLESGVKQKKKTVNNKYGNTYV